LIFPEDLKKRLGKDYAKTANLAAWLRAIAGLAAAEPGPAEPGAVVPGGIWPRVYGLRPPTDGAAQKEFSVAKDFIRAWVKPGLPGRVGWAESKWHTFGHQKLPVTFSLDGPEELAACIGHEGHWARLKARYLDLTARWPKLAQALPKFFRWLGSLPEADYDRAKSVLAWLGENPKSGLYPRQLPIAGLDSKWLEGEGKVVAQLAAVLLDRDPTGGFHAVCGLAEKPALFRLRILDPNLRAQVGGLDLFQAPVAELAKLSLKPKTVFIVENLQTGLAFGDLPGAVLILGHGNGVGFVSEVPWLLGAEKHFYWGDIDRDGLAILARTRDIIPGLVSVFMDEGTLLEYRDLWGEDNGKNARTDLNLTGEELTLLRDLLNDRFGKAVRFEQERMAWDRAWERVEKLARFGQ
jgi:hypothetical protein